MTKFDLILEGGCTVRPDGIHREDVAVQGGRIAALLAEGAEVPARRRLDCRGKFILPGMIDAHVHMGRYGQDFAAERFYQLHLLSGEPVRDAENNTITSGNSD